MTEQEKYELIEKYLQGELSLKKLKTHFHNKNLEFPDDEIDLHQFISTHFPDPQKRNLLTNLLRLRQKHSPQKPVSFIHLKRIVAYAAVFVLFLFAAWHLSKPDQQIERPKMADLDHPEKNIPPIEIPKENIEKSELDTLVRNPIVRTKEQKPQQESGFTASSYFENLIDSIKSPPIAFKLKQNKGDNSISGIIRPKEGWLDEGAVLLIFDNNSPDMKENLAILKEEIAFSNADTEGISGFVQKEMEEFKIYPDTPLKPGLYYYILKNTNDASQLFVGRFLVN